MNVSTKVIASGLAILMGIMSLNDVAAFAGGAPASPELVKQQGDQYGVGAKLNIRLNNGKKLKGLLVSMSESGFELRTKPDAPSRQLAYVDVMEVKPAKLVYRAKGAPDAVEARRVVLGLGLGHHIQVKTTAGKEYHGNIQEIGSDLFTLLPDHQTASVQIAYSEIVNLGPNMSRGSKIALTVGVVAGVLLVLALTIGHLGRED